MKSTCQNFWRAAQFNASALAGYYFYYQTDKATTLSFDTLANIVKSKHEMYIIYADRCLLDEKFMTEHHIKFKKIPRDIKRF